MAEIRAHEEANCLSYYISRDYQYQQALLSLDARLQAWESLLEKGGLGQNECDLSTVINPETFHQVDQKLTAFILNLYTMDTFLVDRILEINQNKEDSKAMKKGGIKNLGPFACALRAIIYGNLVLE